MERIEPALPLASPPAGRTFRRRRLGLLTGVLVATLGMGALVADGGASGESTVAAAAESGEGETRVVGLSEGSVTLAAVFAETTSTLLAVTTSTVADTTTTQPANTSSTSTPSTSTPSSSTSAAPTTSVAPTTSAASRSPSTTAATTTAPPTTAAPSSTSAPRSSPSTTAAPRSSSESDYGDPNSLQVWLDLAQCESDGNWSVNTGNGYYGGLQFSLGTWESVGGSGYPHEHPRDTQIEMGRRLQARDGWGAWPHCSEELGLR